MFWIKSFKKVNNQKYKEKIRGKLIITNLWFSSYFIYLLRSLSRNFWRASYFIFFSNYLYFLFIAPCFCINWTLFYYEQSIKEWQENQKSGDSPSIISDSTYDRVSTTSHIWFFPYTLEADSHTYVKAQQFSSKAWKYHWCYIHWVLFAHLDPRTHLSLSVLDPLRDPNNKKCLQAVEFSNEFFEVFPNIWIPFSAVQLSSSQLSTSVSKPVTTFTHSSILSTPVLWSHWAYMGIPSRRGHSLILPDSPTWIYCYHAVFDC